MVQNSLIIPVYNSENNLNNLIKRINDLYKELSKDLEIIFVIDGSPDNSYEMLKNLLPQEKFSSKIVLLSRNFGTFNAIRTGLEIARGKYFAVMSDDLQEPIDLILNFFKILNQKHFDVVIGVRNQREDPLFSKLLSNTFWSFYKRFIIKEVPRGGFDVFGCNKEFRNNLLKLKENNSSLLGQIFWIGFRRKEVEYSRVKRKIGVSQWSFEKKFKYMLDSIFSFSDFPIKLLTFIGAIGIIFFSVTGGITLISKLFGLIDVPGYASIFLSIGFIGAVNIFSLGLIGSYAWRTYENTKARPLSIILKIEEYN